jgi:hypothetical protein
MHQFHKFILSWNCMFRTVRLSITRSLFTVLAAVVYVIPDYRPFSSRNRMELQFHPGPAQKLSTNPYDIPLLHVQWINSWWWTDELSETWRVSWQNKFLKLVHLLGIIAKKLTTDNLKVATETIVSVRKEQKPSKC